MKNVTLIKILCVVLVPCLLLLSYGCRTTYPEPNPTSEAATYADTGEGLIVETSEDYFYRFESHEWRRDDQGSIQGIGTRHQSLLEANEEVNGVQYDGIIQAETIVNTYKPGERVFSTTGWIVFSVIAIAFSVLAGIWLASELEGCSKGCTTPGYDG